MPQKGNNMPKIDLTGRINGDFVVIGEYKPTYSADGKKKLRWLCQCQTCNEKEVVLGESIRRNKHKYCTYCTMTANHQDELEKDVANLSKMSEDAGYGPITVKQFLCTLKYKDGSLTDEDCAALPEIFKQVFEMI
jgi:hypothetical protein